MVNNDKVSRTKRTERKALLSEADRRNIKSGKMSSTSKSRLYNKLDERLPALMDDLNLIAKSKTLETWRILKKYEYKSEFSKLAKIFEDISGTEFKKIYLERICSSKNSKGKKVFWLEKFSPERILDRLWKKKKPYYSEKIFQPKNILKGSRESRKTKELLMEAYFLQLIPFEKQKAIERKMIQKIIESKKRKAAKKKKMPRCKTCGFIYSPKCPDCKKRFHNQFKDMIKDKQFNEYVMFQNVDTNSF